MLLQVDVEDEIWIADVGFGGMTLTAPLRLVEQVPQATPHEPFRVTRLAGDYALQAEQRGAWRTLYRFDLQEQVLPDYELTSWYALRGNELAVHDLSGDTVRRTLKSADALREALSETFGIALPDSAELDAKLAEIAESG